MATIKQRKAFAEVGVNGGNISKAMAVAGYGKSVRKRTDKLTSTKGWKELMDQFLPDTLLAKRHQQMLNKTEKVIVSGGAKEGSHIEDTGQPHSDVNSALDKAYKLKRKYESEGINNNIVIVNVSKAGAKKYGVNQSTGTDII